MVTKLFNSERLQQERPAYHDNMNNVRFHKTTQHRSAPKPPHQWAMISRMKAEYFTRANDTAAIYALLPEWMHIKELIWVRPLHRYEHFFCWPPSVNKLLSSERLQQKRPAYHDEMNNVRSHRTDEICGSRALCMWCNTAEVFIGWSIGCCCSCSDWKENLDAKSRLDRHKAQS